MPEGTTSGHRQVEHVLGEHTQLMSENRVKMQVSQQVTEAHSRAIEEITRQAQAVQ